MRIGLFGNINNYPYVLALGFQRLGVDVRLAVTRKDHLHRPEGIRADYRGGYPNWILDCSGISEDEFFMGSPTAYEAMHVLSRDCDAIILNDVGPSLYACLAVPTVALLTGSDLLNFADPAFVRQRTSAWRQQHRDSEAGRQILNLLHEFVHRQREGIRNARAVSFAYRGLIPEGDSLLDSIDVKEDKRFFIYMANTIHLTASPPPSNHRFRILNGARLIWKEPLAPGSSPMDNKRTDILLRGFASFVKQGLDGELVLFRKGYHLRETMSLAEELGIINRILWKDEMPLSEYYEEVKHADVICDQLGPSFPGLTTLDALAMGRPTIANIRPDVLWNYLSDQMPTCHATTPDEVCQHLTRLARSSSFRYHLSIQGRQFADHCLSPEANAKKCLEMLHSSVSEVPQNNLSALLGKIASWFGSDCHANN